jgi:hypothetical protein
MSITKTPLYYNPKQLECMAIAARRMYIVASRRFGKSEGIDAPALLRNVQQMPGSMGALLSPTYGKLLKNTLPPIARALARLGYYRDIHYVINRKPDARMGFKKPIIEPFSYDNVIAWYNGSINVLVSFDGVMSVNSMTLDYIMAFEAKFLNYQKIKEEVIPANSPDDYKQKLFGHLPFYNGSIFTTDMPTSSRGMWILDKQKEMNPKLIALIKTVYEQYIYYKHQSSVYAQKMTSILRYHLNHLRSQATFYAEYNVYDNIDILGQEYINAMKRELPPLVFQVSILNQRMHKIENGFYSAFDDTIHTYPARYHNHIIDQFGFDLDKSSRNNCIADADIIDSAPLEIACDYNASINNIVVGQVDGRKANYIKRFWVKTPRKLKEVTQDFCDYYSPRINRDVIYYFDHTAVAESASSNLSFKDEVISILEKNHFNVTAVYIGQAVAHKTKHLQWDNAFKGNPEYLFPQFNEDHCDDLIISIQKSGIKVGRNGFEKDKSLEKVPDSEDSPDEYKTHGTDALDTLFQGMNFFRPDLGFSIPAGVFMN